MKGWIDIGIPRTRVYELERGKHYKVSIRYKDHRNKWVFSPGVDVFGGKTMVKNRIYELLREQEQTETCKRKNMTIRELTQEFEEKRIKLKLVQETTIETDHYLIEKINNTIGDFLVCKLKTKDIENAIQELRECGNSDYRIFRIYGKLKQILEMAIDEEVILKNPCRGIKLRKSDEYSIRKKDRFLTPKEIQRLEKLLYLNPKTGTYVAMYIALLTGMRRGEILALQWKDLNLDTGCIKIYKQLAKNKQLKKTKTEKSTREIIMPKKLIVYLNDWKEIQKYWAHEKDIEFDGEIPVVANNTLTYIRPDNIRRTWTEFFIRNEFAYRDKNGTYIGPHFHSLRDAHATLLFNYGTREKEIQERLGHSQIRTTMDIYTSIFKETKRETARTVDRFFDN